MDIKKLIHADSESFWKYMLKTMPRDDKPVYVATDKIKSTKAAGKNKSGAQ